MPLSVVSLYTGIGGLDFGFEAAGFKTAVALEFAVDVAELSAKRVKINEARGAALYLIRKLTSVPLTELADRYGRVSQAAISKTARARRKTK